MHLDGPHAARELVSEKLIFQLLRQLLLLLQLEQFLDHHLSEIVGQRGRRGGRRGGSGGSGGSGGGGGGGSGGGSSSSSSSSTVFV